MNSCNLPILFFDGVCGLCNRFVNFILKHDRRGQIQMAPLQGPTAAKLLPHEDAQRLDSVVFYKDGRTTRRSTAVFHVLRELGGVWCALAWLLWIVPKPLRDWGYRLVASQRYRLFGRKETCRLPTPEERGRLLE